MGRPKTKQDLDKDLMFRLLMPSSTAPELPEEEELELEVIRPEEGQGDGLSALRGRLFRDGGIPVQRGEAPVLRNLMEQLVSERLDDAFTKFNCCRCDRCRQDVAALALNQLPPRYLVATADRLEQKAQQAQIAEVNRAIVRAILYVRANPRH